MKGNKCLNSFISFPKKYGNECVELLKPEGEYLNDEEKVYYVVGGGGSFRQARDSN